jgi:hypothetical protein
MIRVPKSGDMRPFAFLSAACPDIVHAIHAKAALADALRGKATAGPCVQAGGNPEAWPHYAPFFRPIFGRALGGPAATPG